MFSFVTTDLSRDTKVARLGASERQGLPDARCPPQASLPSPRSCPPRTRSPGRVGPAATLPLSQTKTSPWATPPFRIAPPKRTGTAQPPDSSPLTSRSRCARACRRRRQLRSRSTCESLRDRGGGWRGARRAAPVLGSAFPMAPQIQGCRKAQHVRGTVVAAWWHRPA